MKFINYPNVLIIKQKVNNLDNTFSFKEILQKVGTDNDIPAKISKTAKTPELHFPRIFSIILLRHETLPKKLKLADTTPIFKIKSALNKGNYRSVSVLPVVSKTFKRSLQKQMNCYVKEFLSPYLCGYGKSFSNQEALVSIIKKLVLIIKVSKWNINEFV